MDLLRVGVASRGRRSVDAGDPAAGGSSGSGRPVLLSGLTSVGHGTGEFANELSGSRTLTWSK